MAKTVGVLLLALLALVRSDIYLHNPRGSNNRLDEANRDRNNANRLFDSQNNNRGGYNVGNLYYYERSVLPIEWTNQHSCGDQNNHCEIVFQYMCGAFLRDGATTRTIPDNIALCDNNNCNEDLEYGMHEPLDYYLDCAFRQRNMGLFTADRNLNGETARFTRQNENGNRRGYECPEERDYYPYWHPTPWIDIAILTNDATRCPYYRNESQNVKVRHYCRLPADYIQNELRSINRQDRIPNNQDDCEQWTAEGYDGGAFWVESPPSDVLPEPDCIEALWSRDNHLGNSVGGFPNYYNWTIPNTPHVNCALRVRYNISTGEYDGWNSSVNSSIEQSNEQVLTANNQGQLNIQNRRISPLDVYSKFGFNSTSSKERGYVFRQNPVIKLFPDIAESANNFGLQLAINTNQFGRTFQDRSHAFEIRSRPSNLEGKTICNLNVRGKRGNIVQVYPGVEYDFTPNRLEIANGEYVHIQWTGSNTNPNNNDGQGRAGTDKSNIVLLGDMVYDEGTLGLAVPVDEKNGHFGRSYPNHLNASSSSRRTFLGLSLQDRQDLAFLSPGQFGGELSELDDAGTYFDLGPKEITQIGTYHYMCTRNNNFSNRSQKGKIIVLTNTAVQNRIGWNGGTVTADANTLTYKQGDLIMAHMITMRKFNTAEEAQVEYSRSLTSTSRARRQSVEYDYSTDTPGNVQSSFILVQNEGSNMLTPETENEVTISLELDGSASSNTKIYVSNQNTQGTFRELDTRVESGMAIASTNEDGVYVAASPAIAAYVIVGTVLFVLIIIAIAVIGVIVYFRVRRDKWERVSKSLSGVTRSFQKKI